MKRAVLFSIFCLVALSHCTTKTDRPASGEMPEADSILVEKAVETDTVPKEIVIEKDLLYDQHTLADSYPYKDTTRSFQWDKIRERLTWLESIQKESATWAILQNYRNKNGEAPLVRNYHRDFYRRIADSLGVERFQGVPPLPADRYLHSGNLRKGRRTGQAFAGLYELHQNSIRPYRKRMAGSPKIHQSHSRHHRIQQSYFRGYQKPEYCRPGTG